MLVLDDAELNLIRQAAEPIDRRQRGAFLRDIAAELQRFETISPAVVMRVAQTVQRRHLNGGADGERARGRGLRRDSSGARIDLAMEAD
jgi:hypothetical protein